MGRGQSTAAPITPDEAIRSHHRSIPVEIIEIFNGMISEKISGSGRAVIYLDEVSKRCVDAGIDKQEAMDKKWFDVEPMFREAGWKVEYDQPGYNESGRAHYVFSRI